MSAGWPSQVLTILCMVFNLIDGQTAIVHIGRFQIACLRDEMTRKGKLWLGAMVEVSLILEFETIQISNLSISTSSHVVPQHFK